ncbi:ATP-binding cassette, subfamily C [Amycolatopsis xylanica]|uniref:ATP-binding cassette, subfamily C n=1 Tax=Amycolatopsis xylanica TaxID=589385 RepID=A0A1H3SFI5_9PSEU|nr:ABC transporter ATP-binding protein [Amycolatopsis xylanica]SDZ36311.1 ATP-binding cassette, subfamily C [Amycolatopsis xylanica]
MTGPSIGEFVRPVLAAQRGRLLALTAWSVLEAVPALGSGALVAAALDHGFLAGSVRTGVVFLLAYGAAVAVGTFATRQVMPHVAVLVESLRDELVRLVVWSRLRHSVFGDSGTDTATVAKLTRQAETVRQMFAGLLLTVRGVLFGVAAAVMGLAALDPWLALAAVPFVVGATGLLAVLSRLLRRRYQALLDAQEALAREAGALVGGVRDVVVCGAWRTAAARVGRFVDMEAAAMIASARTGAGRIAVIALGGRVPFVLVLLASPWLVSGQLLTAGSLVGAMTYLMQGLEPAVRALVQTVANLALQLSVTMSGMLEVPPTPLPKSRTKPLTSSEILLRGVTFAYGPHAEPVLSGVDLRVPAALHLAVVGPSGVGKSTLASLIAGIDSPDSGVITVGGTPVTEVVDSALRRHVVLIPQEAYVFTGTVRENLTYLRQDADDAELGDAVETLGLADVVRRLGGYDGVVERPSALSQGERQLISLARVYLSPAEVVILDEATCHLDPAAEAIAEEAFARRPGTLIVIAHRISSAMRAERVLVMGAGSLVQGTHEELMRSSPDYARLVGHWWQPTLCRTPALGIGSGTV